MEKHEFNCVASIYTTAPAPTVLGNVGRKTV